MRGGRCLRYRCIIILIIGLKICTIIWSLSQLKNNARCSSFIWALSGFRKLFYAQKAYEG